MLKNSRYSCGLMAAILIAASALTACGKTPATGDSTQSAVNISGSLVSGTNALVSFDGGFDGANASPADPLEALISGANSASSAVIDFTTLQVYCVTFAIPPSAGTGTVSASGAFSVSIPGAANQPFGCFIRQASTVLATLVFKDSTSMDMSGNSKTSSQVALSGDAVLGSIVLDTTSGKAVADVANFSDKKTTVAANTAAANFDFTGTWRFKAVDFALPQGYSAACAVGDSSCHGPALDMPIYLKRIAGKSFSPDTTCQSAVTGDTLGGSACGGTTGTDSRYAVAIWESSAADVACGTKLGFTFDQAKAFGHVDFSASTLISGPFTWDAAWGASGWKNSAATAQHDISSCESVQVGSQHMPGWKCYDSVSSPTSYQVSLSGGCVITGTNTHVQPDSWAGINTCTGNSAFTGTDATGYLQNSCSGTAPVNGVSRSLTCTNVFGTFRQSDSAAIASSGFTYSNVAKFLNAGDKCDGTNHLGGAWTPAGNSQLQSQNQCYAEYYYQNKDSGAACMRDVRLDWSTTDPAKFVLDNHGPARARKQFVMELFDYSSPTAGSFHQEQVDIRGVHGNNSSTPCRTLNKFTMNLTKVSDVKVLADYTSETVLLDTGDLNCVANTNQLGVGSVRQMMYMVK